MRAFAPFLLICVSVARCDVLCVTIYALCAARLPFLTAADCERLWGCRSGKVLLAGIFSQHAGVSSAVNAATLPLSTSTNNLMRAPVLLPLEVILVHKLHICLRWHPVCCRFSKSVFSSSALS